MTLYQLKCPGCGAILDVDNTTIDVMYCKYCGSKILLDGQNDTTIKAKADIIMQKEDLQHRQRIAELEEETKRQANKANSKTITIAFIAIFLLIAVMCALLLYRF